MATQDPISDLSKPLQNLPTSTPEQAEPLEKPTIPEAIAGSIYSNFTNDSLFDMGEVGKNQAYLDSLSTQGNYLSPNDFKSSPYFRPGLDKQYPMGLSSAQAQQLATNYDIQQGINEEMNNMSTPSRVTAQGVGGLVSFASQPLNFAMMYPGETLAEGALLSARSALPALDGIMSTSAGKIAASAIKGASAFAAPSAAFDITHAAMDDGLRDNYGYLQAANDIISQSEMGLAFGAIGGAFGEGLEYLKGSKKPSEVLPNMEPDSAHDQVSGLVDKVPQRELSPTDSSIDMTSKDADNILQEGELSGRVNNAIDDVKNNNADDLEEFFGDDSKKPVKATTLRKSTFNQTMHYHM
jgi:hypothetical protein